MEKKQTREITAEEFYELLERNRVNVNNHINKLNDEINAIKSCSNMVKTIFGEVAACNIPMMARLLEKPEGKKTFIKVLKTTFGEDFFNDLNEKELQKVRESNSFTKYSIEILLTVGYGKYYGYDFNKPDNWDEFLEYIVNCFNVCQDSQIMENSKTKFHSIILSVKKMIEFTYPKRCEELQMYIKANDVLDMFIKPFKQKQMINLTEEDKKLVKETLNGVDNVFYDATDENLKKIGFGDAFIELAETYNINLEEANKKIEEEKQARHNNVSSKSKVKKYFSYLSKANPKNINGEKLPSYSDPDFQNVMKELLELFKDNEKYISINAILSAYYIAYFKSEDYKKVYVDGQTNEIEPRVIK